MTASTAPITLPVRHRQEEIATSRPQMLVLLLGFVIQLVAWNVGDIARRRGRRHLVVLTFAVGLVVLAAAGSLLPAS